MALTTAQIQNAYVAFFNRPADVAGLQYWSSYAGNSADLLNTFAQSAEYNGLYAGMNSTQLVSAVYQNLFGRSPEVSGLTYWVGQLDNGALKIGNIAEAINKGAQGTDADIITNKVTAATAFTNALDTTDEIVAYAGANTTALNAVKSWLNTVTSDAASVTAATGAPLTAVLGTVQNNTNVNAGQTLTLKIGEDRLVGGSGNDTFIAPANEQQGATGSAQTLEGFDILDGGTGIDTLSATLFSGAAVTPTLSNIENVVVRVANAGSAIDLGASTGVQSVTVQNSTAATGTIANLGAVATLAVKNQNQNVTFDGSTAATLGLTLDTFGKNVNGAITANSIDLGATAAAKATTLNLAANNAYAVINSTVADAVSTVTIAATGTNQVSFVDSGDDIKSATITGAGSVDLTPTALSGALATFNASASTGDVKAIINSTALATVTTGAGNDLINMSAVVTAGTTVNLGAGNDTLLTGALLGNFAKIDGGEGTDTINITDGSKLTAATSKLISNFEVLDVSGGKGDYDVSLNNFATVQIDEAVNGALNGAVGFTNAADSFTLNVASNAKDGDFAVGQAITVTGKDYAGTTALGTAETFTLVANMRDGNKDDTAHGNIDANTITVAGVENLVVESNVSTLDGGSKALNAAQHTLTAKFVATEAEIVTIKGAGSVDLSSVTTIGVVTKVDATASTGNVKIDLSTHTKSVAYFGSEGVDTLVTGTKGDNIYTGKGADIVTLTDATVRDTFVLKAATDSQIGDTDKSGKITLAGDEAKAGVQQIDTINGFTAGGTAASDRLDVTNFAFSGAQRGVVDANTLVGVNTDLTSIADLFAAPAGDRGIAFSNAGGGDLYVFVDANKDGNFTAADDLLIKLVGMGAVGLSEVDVNF